MIHVEIWERTGKCSGYWKLVGSFTVREAAERCWQLYKDAGHQARIA